MSGIGEGRNTRAVSVEALEDEAASWLLKRNFFNWTPDDQINLDAWLETPSNQVVYWRLNAALARTERLAALRLSRREASERTGRAQTHIAARRRGGCCHRRVERHGSIAFSGLARTDLCDSCRRASRLWLSPMVRRSNSTQIQ